MAAAAIFKKSKNHHTDFLKVPPNKNERRKTPKFRKGSAAMLLNHYISAAVRAISTKFGIVMQFHPLDRSDR